MNRFFGLTFIRYVLVGIFASAIEYGSFWLLFVTLGAALVVANGLSFCLGLLTAFLLNRVWAFATHEYSKRASRQLVIYTCLAIFNLLLTLVLVAIFKHLGIDPRIGKLLAMVITSLWNFVILRLVVFAHTDQKPV